MDTSLSRRTIVGLTAAAAVVPPARAATPEKIAVMGTGNVGSALGKRWAALGHTVMYGSRTPDGEKVKALVAETGHGATAVSPADAAAECDLILIAVPTRVAVDLVKSLGNLAGKVLIDATNLLMMRDGKFNEPLDGTCIALQIQEAAPQANVVKAFNTTQARVMFDTKITGGPVSLPIAGASRESKARVAVLAEQLGFQVADIGGADWLRMIEHLGRLYVGYGGQNRPKRIEFHFTPWG